MGNEIAELLIGVGWFLIKYITLPILIACVLLLSIYKWLKRKGHIE